jgi:hypothetical protein
MKRGRVAVVLYAHTNQFCKCRAVYCQGGVGMQSVTASERLAKRNWDWDCQCRQGERECHELAAGRLQLHR